MGKMIKKLCALLLVATLIGSLLTACGGGSSSASPSAAVTPTGTAEETVNYDDIVVNYGLTSGWSSLNPYASTGGYYTGLVLDKLYDKLVYIGESALTLSPRAATSWEVSEDGKTLTFQLDPNSKWHDGTPVTAADWVFTFQLATDAGFENPLRSNFNIFEGTDGSGIELSENSVGIEAPDDHTLVMHMKAITNINDFITQYSAMYFVLPQHILGEMDAAAVSTSDFWSAPVGSGPCTFISEVPGNTLELGSFADYQLGAPKFGKLVMKVVAQINIVTSVMSGELDCSYPYLSVDDAKYAQQQEGLVVTKSSSPVKLQFMLINNQNISNKLVRQAMNYAIDKQLMVDQLLEGEAAVAETYIIPSSDYLNTDLPSGRDVDKAKQLLAEAGWDSNRTVKMAVPSDIRAKEAALIQQNFEEVGIKLEIETVDTATMFSGVSNGTYDLGIMAVAGTNYPLFLSWFYDYRSAAYAQITDTQFAEKQDEIKVELDETKRIELVKAYQALLDDEMPMVMLFHQYNFALTSARLTNINPLDSQQYNDAVWEWVIK